MLKSFHHSDFPAAGLLADEKAARGLRISLCFPTLNEVRTIGTSISRLRRELVEAVPLLDEILVVDSGSEDGTLDMARSEGARAFSASEILPDEGGHRGKGENMWKALHAATGDILVFLDADVENMHPRFVQGLVGPLLNDSGVLFVKGYYHRPETAGEGMQPAGGGRVTEILIRPLFSQFFPELAVFAQPLSGECAGYRKVFEDIPFPVGYGIETGLLIDIGAKFGLEAMAQTDLEIRIHRHQSLEGLGRMSFGILQTFWNRMIRYGKVESMRYPNLELCKMVQGASGLEVSAQKIQEYERRPMHEVPAYQERFPRAEGGR